MSDCTHNVEGFCTACYQRDDLAGWQARALAAEKKLATVTENAMTSILTAETKLAIALEAMRVIYRGRHGMSASVMALGAAQALDEIDPLASAERLDRGRARDE